MVSRRAGDGPHRRWVLSAFCSAVTTGSFAMICIFPAGPVRVIAGLSLLGAFTCALWLLGRARWDAVVPAVGLTLAFLILAGFALAAVHALSPVPAALAVGVAALAAGWASVFCPATELGESAERRARSRPPNPLVVIGTVMFAAATILAVRYAVASATADGDAGSSVAVWVYPTGGQLQVGVLEPAGNTVASLRIVVTQAGVTAATWDIRVPGGKTWNAPALTLTGHGPVQVVALQAGTVVASLSASLD
jgi:hypothetical protein